MVGFFNCFEGLLFRFVSCANSDCLTLLALPRPRMAMPRPRLSTLGLGLPRGTDPGLDLGTGLGLGLGLRPGLP